MVSSGRVRQCWQPIVKIARALAALAGRANYSNKAGHGSRVSLLHPTRVSLLSAALELGSKPLMCLYSWQRSRDFAAVFAACNPTQSYACCLYQSRLEAPMCLYSSQQSGDFAAVFAVFTLCLPTKSHSCCLDSWRHIQRLLPLLMDYLALASAAISMPPPSPPPTAPHRPNSGSETENAAGPHTPSSRRLRIESATHTENTGCVPPRHGSNVGRLLLPTHPTRGQRGSPVLHPHICDIEGRHISEAQRGSPVFHPLATRSLCAAAITGPCRPLQHSLST